MSDPKHYETAPEDRVSLTQKIAYGLGSFVNNILGNSIGYMAIVLNVGLKMNPALVGLLMAIPRFTDAFTDPVMGYISDHTKTRWGRRRPFIFAGALFAGIIFALMWQLPAGHSEMFYFWFFLIGSILYFLACTVYSTPWVALGYEMTPDYHERTKLMGFSNFMGQVFFAIGPWFYAFMNWDKFESQVVGAKVLAIVLGVFVAIVGLLPAIFGREPMKQISETENKEEEKKLKRIKGFSFSNYLASFTHFIKNNKFTFLAMSALLVGAFYADYMFIAKYMKEKIIWDIPVIIVISITIFLVYLVGIPALNYEDNIFEIEEYVDDDDSAKAILKTFNHNMIDFFQGLIITLSSKPFLKLCAATFFLFNGFMLVSGLGSYITIYYVFAGDTAQGSVYMGYFGTVSSIATFCVIPLATWLSKKIGKRRAFIICTAVSVIGYLMKWWCYDPAHPKLMLLPAPFIAFGLGCLFTLVGSMMGDVCDLDELNTGHRREGVFGAIYWWMVKLGITLAFAFSGYLLNSTGFNAELGGAQAEKTITMLRIYDISVPIATTLIAIFAIYSYKITEQRAHEIRGELEERRGKAQASA